MIAATGATQPEHLVLYDGACGFCHRSVRWVIGADRDGHFRFAPLQGPTASDIRRRHPELPQALDSIILVERTAHGERLYWNSAAAFRIAGALGGRWRRLAWLAWLPHGLTDLGYRLFARVRLRIFGGADACALPTPGHAERFLP